MRRIIIILILVIFGSVCSGEVPKLISYQGRLLDPNGVPLSGTFSITFTVYTSLTGPSSVWSETQTITTTKGFFNVLLGSVTPLEADDSCNA